MMERPDQEPQQTEKNPKSDVVRSNILTAAAGASYLLCLLAATAILVIEPKERIKLGLWQAKRSSSLISLPKVRSQGIGIVKLEGMIAMERKGAFMGDNMVERVNKSLAKLAAKDSVKAIILRINSPGGMVASSQEIYAQVTRLRQKHNKPIVALLGDVAASGGYYIASACDSIVAQPGTLTGSIGVIFQTGEFAGLFKKYGIEFNTIKSGRYKDIGNFSRAMTPDERRILQDVIDSAYEQFVGAVADGRKLPAATVKELADGRIYIGDNAMKLHLVDSTGGYQAAIDIAKELGGIDGEPEIVTDTNIREDIIGELFKANALTDLKVLLPPAGLLYLWTGY